MQALPAAPATAPQRQLLIGSALASAAMFMLVGGMLAVWVAQRDAALALGQGWVPSSVTIPEVPTNVMLISFGAIVIFVQWARWSARRGDKAHTVFALAINILVALLIVNAQAYVYHEMELPISDGTYAAMFYALTGTFVALMIIGILFSVVALFRYAGGRADDNGLVVAHAIFWTAISAVYVAVWFVVYVTK